MPFVLLWLLLWAGLCLMLSKPAACLMPRCSKGYLSVAAHCIQAAKFAIHVALGGACLWHPKLVAPALQNSDHVWVDPHILCTPAIADIDSDGVDEMVVAVSYYFDRAYYDSEVSLLPYALPTAPSWATEGFTCVMTLCLW